MTGRCRFIQWSQRISNMAKGRIWDKSFVNIIMNMTAFSMTNAMTWRYDDELRAVVCRMERPSMDGLKAETKIVVFSKYQFGEAFLNYLGINNYSFLETEHAWLIKTRSRRRLNCSGQFFAVVDFCSWLVWKLLQKLHSRCKCLLQSVVFFVFYLFCLEMFIFAWLTLQFQRKYLVFSNQMP